jgi:SAM-dependent methyltransferase
MAMARETGHPLERLMRVHPRSRDPMTLRALAILRQENPSDVFALMQWSVGLPYFRQRLVDWELSGDRCLDFGCGTGNWTLAASRLFGRVIGIDIKPEKLRAAMLIRDALDITNAEFKSGDDTPTVGAPQLDCILLYNVLPYIANRGETIRRLISLLKPTGRVVVSFNEIGVWPYYVVSGIQYRDYTYLRRALVAPEYFLIDRCLRGRSVFESRRGWFRTATVVAFFRSLGFDALWKSWDTPGQWPLVPLFPHKKFCLPFFREIVFQRRL